MKKNYLPILVIIMLLLLSAVGGWFYYLRQFRVDNTEQNQTESQQKLETVQTELETPWEIVFGPENEIYITERPGRLRILRGGEVKTIQIANIEETAEGGLMGIALHPDFSANKQIFLYKTTRQAGNLTNIVERYRLQDDQLTEQMLILGDIPAAARHDGGRIAFGPDRFLYITTGDAEQSNLAQDTNSLAGKILRVTDTGEPAPDNPFNNRTYSYGHRNPEGLAWDNQGRLWATEHGPTANDELNRIEIGKNYGWPLIQGSQTRAGLESPTITSGGNTWAPAGLAFLNGRLYFGGLREAALLSVELAGDGVKDLKTDFSGEYGRIRAITAKENNIYFSTSNRDGRGIPKPGDDKVIRLMINNKIR